MANRMILLSLLSAVLLCPHMASCATTYRAQAADGAVENSTEASADKQEDVQKQWLAFGFPKRASEKTDFFLIWLKPYEQFIPKPVQDMINQQVRPQTEQISSQISSNLVGSEQMFQQLSQILGSLNSILPTDVVGGLPGGSGSASSGALSSLMQSVGRRR